MRNIHKIRDKREFLFDDRELVILGGGALIICVLIFVFGFLVGQSRSVAIPLESEDYMAKEEFTSAESEMSDTSVAEESSQEVPADQKKHQLSYYRTLPDTGTFVEVEATPVRKSTPAPSSPEESQLKKAGSDTPQQDVKEETPPSRPSETATALPRQGDIAVAPALPNVPKSPTDVMQIGRPARHTEERAGFTGSVYSVQVSSSSNRADSERLQQKYIELGYQAYVMPADLGERGIWFRVLVGHLATKEEAEQLKREILNRAAHLARDPLIKVIE